MTNKIQLPEFGLILALGIIVSTYLITDMVRDVRLSHQIIKVRGYAEKTVSSDFASWTVELATSHPDLQSAYPIIEAHKAKTLTFLNEKGIRAQEIEQAALSLIEIRARNQNGYETNEIEAYRLAQFITVNSTDVEKIARLSTEISSLIAEGINLISNAPQYSYSKANELKSELLTQATQDARERAKLLAEGSGVELGVLRAARQGEFSVRAANSSSVSYEGAYDDTSAIEKKLTAVVTVDYAME